jgi:hypothetical protein
MDNLLSDKKRVRDQILTLKKKGIIKYDSDLAKEMDYSKGAISEMLSEKSPKPVTYAFSQKFKEKFGKYLGEKPERSELSDLKAEVSVLRQTLIELLAKSNKKSQALIAAELDKAVKMKIKG